ncbi:MAG: phenylalanine--tRNA ligase subunit alpha [Caulobacterales bacterium]|nr:phenylalanine--tRNA ligase subunit alpha [Caulobacterales bacterium]
MPKDVDTLDSDQLSQLEAEANAAFTEAADEAALDAARVAFLGKKGRLSLLMRELGRMSPEERQVMGPALNGLKDRLNALVAERKDALETAALDARLAGERVDVTLPARPEGAGRIHPVSQVTEELIAIFAEMGFDLAVGPDIETGFNNFTALNFPPGHPAREMHDTFFLNAEQDGERLVLRTHTSPVQIRTMLSQKPPIRIIAPGRTYRSDWDATHTPLFHQVEGLVIDTETHMGHLKGCLMEFIAAFFEVDDLQARFRPHFFPFTEPSAEMDVRYERVGDAVKIGQGEKWMEILGCGMVHPNVIANCGLDPEVYQGFAFGVGIDRLAMLKYGMADLRPFFEPDVRWLSHYGFTPLLVPNLATGLS